MVHEIGCADTSYEQYEGDRINCSDIRLWQKHRGVGTINTISFIASSSVSSRHSRCSVEYIAHARALHVRF
jgi:hypothetical protein